MTHQLLTIHVSASTGKMFRPFIKQSILRAHSLLKPALKEISIALVGDQTMSRLHRKFMGIDSPTDVLTFELDHDPRGRVLTAKSSSAYRRQPAKAAGAAFPSSTKFFSMPFTACCTCAVSTIEPTAI